jgi:hypothetical protein
MECQSWFTLPDECKVAGGFNGPSWTVHYLTVCCGGQAALATLIGTAGSYAYLRWLIHDCDSLSESWVEPFRTARQQPSGLPKTLLLGYASYRSASLLTTMTGCMLVDTDWL